ncbi:hypothetical protein O1611_g1195 [Lasiodiplodia mahajangana]|uniref:Uncharacterized protein n=1 Tax=Lasiodiplodia mahajangana TaxID=1108764 RepID=A0ACC2JYP0_9PEZI|nr:hypothetical protein O1611_g1195 [Lasiodiplodia mahajangana]
MGSLRQYGGLRRTILSVAIFGLSFIPAFVQGDGTCSPTSPCVSGCCSSTGYCGFGPDYCGSSCISNCDALAECGQYAKVPGTKCPLNVCCSQYGFCGTTSEFCDKDCQSGCATPSKPSCSSSGGSAMKKRIGYYESWSTTRSCGSWTPSNIDPTKWTHLNYAFALVDPNTFGIAQMNTFDVELYTEFTGLKRLNPSLSVYISIGGWDAGGKVFSDMVSTSANRASFISSLQLFMKTYGFDGVDIDWEYPGADDRGGNAADFTNYVTLLSELRSALGTRYGITVTLPSSYWYMQHFDITNMEKYLDWFNVMTYDIHGTWDGNNPYTSAVVQAHTNLTEIDQAMDLLWRNQIDSSKVVLGLGFYGRSFTLKDPSCKTPGCPFSGGAKPGPCTATSGILSDAEIQNIISSKDLTPVLDTEAAVKYMSWDDDQWVSYDDEDTFKMKLDYANGLCLGGTMVWALDMDAVGTDNSIDNLGGGASSGSLKVTQATVKTNSLSLGLFWTPCLPKETTNPCPKGFRALAWGHGKVFDADLSYNTGEGCHGGGINGFQRALCAASNVLYSSLQWGPGKVSKACNSKCPKGWVTLTKNSHITGQKTGCKSGKYAPLCGYEVTVFQNADTCSSSITDHLLSGSLSNAIDPDGVSDYDFEDDGTSATNAKLRAFREIKSRKVNRKMKQKRSIYSGAGCLGDLPLGSIPLDIPAVVDKYIQGGNTYYEFESTAPSVTQSARKPTITVYNNTESTKYSTVYRTCNGALYPQACYHYSSVAQRSTYSRATCSNYDQSNNLRPLTQSYNNGHRNKEWFSYIAKSYINPNGKRKGTNCQRDEWPPAHFQQGRPDGWIRLLPGDQNGPAANNKDGGWRGICQFPPKKETFEEGGEIVDKGDYYLLTSYTSTIVTLNVLSYTWTNVNPPVNDYRGLTANTTPGTGGLRKVAYNNDPGSLTKGVSKPTYRKMKRFEFSEGRMVVNEGNSTRLATDEEIEKELGYTPCRSGGCSEELEILRQQQAEANMPTLVHDSPLATGAVVSAIVTAVPTVTSPTLAGGRPALMAHASHPTAG